MTLAVVLAGGRSSRMGRDKAFVRLAGTPLIEHALHRLTPQAERVIINSNADPTLFARYDVPVVADAAPGVAGPLAGIYTVLVRWPYTDIVTVAIDLPFIPADLVATLRGGDQAPCRYARPGLQHALAIWWPPHSHIALQDYLMTGRRDLHGWLQQHGEAVACAPALAFNVNTPDELRDAERILATAPFSSRLSTPQVNAA